MGKFYNGGIAFLLPEVNKKTDSNIIKPTEVLEKEEKDFEGKLLKVFAVAADVDVEVKPGDLVMIMKDTPITFIRIDDKKLGIFHFFSLLYNHSVK